MEIGVVGENDIKLARLSTQKNALEKKLGQAMRRSGSSYPDSDEVKKWHFHLLQTEKAISRLVNGVHY